MGDLKDKISEASGEVLLCTSKSRNTLFTFRKSGEEPLRTKGSGDQTTTEPLSAKVQTRLVSLVEDEKEDE